MILSTLSFALMNALVKYLISYHTFQLVFFRSLGSLIITFSILKSKNIPLLGNQKTLLLIRGLVGVSAMILFFLGIKYIGVASSVTLRYTSPIFAAILAVIFFKEKIKIPQWTFFILAFFGVYLIKSFQPLSSSIGVLMVLGAAFLSAIVYLIISKIDELYYKNIEEKSVKNKVNLDTKKDKLDTNKKSFKMNTSFLKND